MVKGRRRMVPSIDIVIVNWNAGALLCSCLDSLAEHLPGGPAVGRVVVVDNASDDGSADRLRDDMLPLHVVRSPQNRGFAVACNQGATGSYADYLLFLNPDTRLFADTLVKAVDFLEKPNNSGIGVLGVQLVDEGGIVQRSCARVPTPARLLIQSIGLDRLAFGVFQSCPMLEWDHADTRDVDQVMGAFLIIRRALFESLGGFDERFFVYFDDVDLCARARQAGHRVVHFAGARAYHLGCGTTVQIKDRRLFYSLRSRLLYAGKHFGGMAAACVCAATLLIEPMVRLLRAFARFSVVDTADVLRATCMLWYDLPSCLQLVFKANHAIDPST